MHSSTIFPNDISSYSVCYNKKTGLCLSHENAASREVIPSWKRRKQWALEVKGAWKCFKIPICLSQVEQWKQPQKTNDVGSFILKSIINIKASINWSLLEIIGKIRTPYLKYAANINNKRFKLPPELHLTSLRIPTGVPIDFSSTRKRGHYPRVSVNTLGWQ